MRALVVYPPAPRLRQPRTRLACFVLLVPLIAVPPALAQSAHTHPGAPAAEPGAATAPLAHPAPPARTALADLPTGQTWQGAHHAVGQFPRGHADIVLWEQQQGTAPAVSSPPSHRHRGAEAAPGAATKPMPPHHRSHHGGQPMHGSKP